MAKEFGTGVRDRAIDVPSIDIAGLRGSARIIDTGVAITLAGAANHEIAEALTEFLERAHAAAVVVHATDVDVELRDLSFMVSSCMKPLVAWIASVQALPEGLRYRIRFLSNRNHGWQKRSLTAMTCFAPALIRVELVT